MTTRSRSKKAALQDKEKDSETSVDVATEVIKPVTKRSLRRSRGSDVSNKEASDEEKDKECDKKTDGTEGIKKETKKDEDTHIHGEENLKKADIQENKKSVCNTTISQVGSISEAHGQSPKSKSTIAVTIKASEKSGSSRPLQATDNASLISSDNSIVEEKHERSQAENTVNKPSADLGIKECIVVLKDTDIVKHTHTGNSNVQPEITYGKEKDKASKEPEIKVSPNTTNKSAESLADNQSSKSENKVGDEQGNVKHVVCDEKNLWISGLDGEKTRAADLKTLFSKNNCKVVSAKIVTNARSSRKQFYGFITMATTEDALTCIQHFNKTELHGKTISIKQTGQANLSLGQSGRKIMKIPISNQNETKDIGGNVKEKINQKCPIKEKNSKINETMAVDKVNVVSEKEKNSKPGATTEKTQAESQEATQNETQNEEQIVPVEEGGRDEASESGEMTFGVTAEMKAEDDEQKKIDGAVEEKKAIEKRGLHAKERGIRSRDRSRERRRSHRSRSRSRDYLRRDSRRDSRYFRAHGFGPRFYPRRPFMPQHLMEREFRDRYHHEVEEHRDSRRHDVDRADYMARKNKEDSFKIKQERERLRIEKEELERARAEVLRKEREQQRAERDELEREKAELRKRSQLNEMDGHHRLKRPFDEREDQDYFLEERKRLALVREPGPKLPSSRYSEFPRDRPVYPERRPDRFEGRPKDVDSPDFIEQSRRGGHPTAEIPMFPRGNRHHSPERNLRERTFDRPHHGNVAAERGHFDHLHPWEVVQNDRPPPNKFGPPPVPVGRPQWSPVRKDDNWGPLQRPPLPTPPPPGPPQERWAGLELPHRQPPMNLIHPPNIGPPVQLRPMYGGAGNELHRGSMPGNFPRAHFNVTRPF